MANRNQWQNFLASGISIGVAALLGLCQAAPVSAGLQGMHPTDQEWVDEHGDIAEDNTSQCKSCHGTDLRGTALSRTFADRNFDADDYGRKFFWQGFQVGCFACHRGPDSERINPNRPARVYDVSLQSAGGAPITQVLRAEDPDGDDLELRIVSYPAHGSAELDGRALHYAPAAGFGGDDELTYAAWDGSTDSNLGRVLLSVGAAPPTATMIPPTATMIPPTATMIPPTATMIPPPATPTRMIGGNGTPSPTRSPVADSCPGDCDDNGSVEVTELILAVRIALDGTSTVRCSAADGDSDGLLSVGELVLSVRSALSGCGVETIPTSTRTRTRTPSPGLDATGTAVATASAPSTPTNTPLPAASSTPSPTAAGPAFDAVAQSFVSAGCASSFCHSRSNSAGGLSLAGSSAYDDMVGVAPVNSNARDAGLLLVAPGDPDRSFLLIKILSPGPGQGAPMPGLSPAQLEVVRAWIAAGAAR